MKITTLVENTSISSEYKSKHGLSFYIETEKHKILFDLGSGKLFLENAKHLGVDVSTVDVVIISHGHVDHGRALSLFIEKNKTAKIYIQRTAFQPHYTKMLGLPIYIGLDNSLKSNEQIILIDDKLIIDDELQLFEVVTERECYSTSNNVLYVKRKQELLLDDFEHEQYLIITEHGKSTLFAGCAHKGIVNIQRKTEQILGYELSNVISGFHLYNPISKKGESDELITQIGKFLKQNTSKYYTCHCTGKKAFDKLKNIIGEQITYLSTGSSLNI